MLPPMSNAVAERGLLPPGDRPLQAAHAGLVLLAMLSGFPLPQAVDEALRLAGYHSASGGIILEGSCIRF